MKTHRIFCTVAFGLVLMALFSCMNYYKISSSSQNSASPDTVIQANSQHYFILRNGDTAYHMRNITISADKKSLTCLLDTLPSEHKLHLTNGGGGKMRYKKTESEVVVVNEVHIYVQPDQAATAGINYHLSFDRIKKIEALEHDRQRTSDSYLWGGLGITLGTAAVQLTIAAISASNMW